MTPEEIYALPDRRIEPWHVRIDDLRRFTSAWHRLDPEAGHRAHNADVTIREKLSRASSHRETIEYLALYQAERPFGILINLENRGRPRHHAILTDRGLYEVARTILMPFELPDPDQQHIAPTSPLDELAGVGACRVHRIAGTWHLLPRTHFDRAGEIVLDETAFRKAFEAIVRPVYAGTAMESYVDGIRNPTMQKLTRQAIALAVTNGYPTATRFTPPRRQDIDQRRDPDLADILQLQKTDQRCAWCGVLTQTEDGTYLIGLTQAGLAGHFRWIENLIVERLGDRDLFDRLKLDDEPDR